MNTNNKMAVSEEQLTASKEDKVLMFLITMLCLTVVKIENILNNYEGIMTDYEGDTACVTISADNFTDIDLLNIGRFTTNIIGMYNMDKPQYELINIEVLDDVVILKVKV